MALPPKPKCIPKPKKLKPLVKPKPKLFVKHYHKSIVNAKIHVIRAPRVRVATPVYRPRVIAPRFVPPVVVRTVESLPVVPARQTAELKAYKVIDFDENCIVTLLVDGQPTPVRLLGVEPPQEGTAENPPGALPEEAVRFGRDLLVGEFVYLAYDSGVQRRDAEGKLVAYLYRASDNLLANLELIRKGYGTVAKDYAFEQQELFLASDQEARATGKGIWAMLAEANR
jgi:micrococcal nuclease